MPFWRQIHSQIHIQNRVHNVHIQLIKWYQNVIIMNRYEQDVFCVCVCGVMMYVPFKRAKTLKTNTYKNIWSDVKCLDLERPSTTPAENCRWATLCSPKARDRLCHPWRLVEWLAWSSSEEAQRFWICCQPLSLNTIVMVKKQPEQTWWANHQFCAFPPHDPVCGCVSTILPFLFQQLLSGRIFRKTLRKSTSGCASTQLPTAGIHGRTAASVLAFSPQKMAWPLVPPTPKEDTCRIYMAGKAGSLGLRQLV